MSRVTLTLALSPNGIGNGEWELDTDLKDESVVMEYFDTHVHLDKADEAGDLPGLMQRARDAGVTRMVAVGGAEVANDRALRIAGEWQDVMRAAVGWDRDQAARGDVEGIRDRLTALLNEDARRLIVAVGEIGLDFHYHPETRESQIVLFRMQLEVARKFLLPAIVHTRDADAETMEELRRHGEEWKGRPGYAGVVHCFTGGPDFAKEILATGFCISFSGIVTFKNAQTVRAAAKMVPEDRLLVETDTPFLAPEPMRGKGNEPANVRHVVETLARERGVACEELAATLFDNAVRLFEGSTCSRHSEVCLPGMMPDSR